ncbi:AAA family ATPase, partial [Streptomyces sp. NPDC051940]|uniref:AAA family ATPase n=1 Tax=Streptomyces sp. NPDC051940 TaxID=3155675 RepID=UPI003413EFCB
MAPEWPLTGRDEELRFIASALRTGDAGAGVVLAGPAGVGKTRLAREACALAEARGGTVRWVYGTASARALPLGAFGGLPEPAGASPSALLRRAAEALDGAQVVAVDDAHLLDDVSATVVHSLAVRRTAAVVLTVRSDRPGPDAIAALWKDEHVTRLEIGPLTREQTTALVQGVLDGPLDAADAARLWTLTGGNALFLRHLVEGEREAGRLRRAAGVWQWPEQPAMTAALAGIVRDRMGELPDAVGETVDLLALGEPLGSGLLAALTEPAAVEEAEARGLVRVDTEGRRLQARLAHPLYGELRRSQLGTLRARRLRGRIAAALAGTGARRSDDTLRRAVLALDADLPPDPELFVAAAHHAVRLLDLPLGERLAGAAVAAGGGFEAELVHAHALSWLTRGEEADRILTRLAAGATDPLRAVRVAVPRAANLLWTLRSPQRSEAVLAAALPEAKDDAARAALEAVRSALDASQARPRAALETGLRVCAAPQAPDQAVVMAACGVAAAGAVLGRLDDVRRVAPLGYRAAARSFDAGVMSFGLADLHILALRLAGDVRAAEEIAGERWDASAEVPGPARLMGRVLLGQAALASGRVRTAVDRLREARAGLESLAAHEFRHRCRLHLTQALALSGDAPGARRMLTELLADEHPAYRVLAPDVVLARAWVAAAEGSTSEAAGAAREAAELARTQDAPAYEVLALQTAVCFGDRAAADRLAELAPLVQGPRAPLAAAHARALADGDVRGVLEGGPGRDRHLRAEGPDGVREGVAVP